MGTRSLTHIYDNLFCDEPDLIVTFFRHFDGYPDGHGQDLADYLKGRRCVNGIGGDFNPKTDDNRIGSAAVKLMAHISDVSSAEVFPPGSSGCGEEYTYEVAWHESVGKYAIKVIGGYSDKVQSVTAYADEYDGKLIARLLSEDDEDRWSEPMPSLPPSYKLVEAVA